MRQTVTERVLAYLKEHPSTPLEVAKNMPAKRRHTRMGDTYIWGDWGFKWAEKEGLIEMDDQGRYHVKEATE